ncbi:MAG: hypothetical protein HN392_02680 [Anaerolineae bacterium]|jgi:hypothetical protein|nr:hypothetical protein [Anaerolineae bacterium]MBT7075389.1 hypothetical protein [Anaerolineae bacterium]MBT7781372.1 hypothetical protein [Anaerolineae bacterium]
MAHTHNDNDILASIPKNNTPPKRKLLKPKTAPPSQSQTARKTSTTKPKRTRGEKFLRALWTITSIISMTVNIIFIILFGLLLNLYTENQSSLVLPEGIDLKTPENLLKGLYDNFQLMDEAHIIKDIPVNTSIPVVFDLHLNEETVVILTEPVTINGARVTLSTGGLNIVNAPATVTLPKDTLLPIKLDLIVPVEQMVDVNLNVAVDIPLDKTDLNVPFIGLQDVVRPLYCLVAPDALSIHGEAICPQNTAE